MFAELICRTVYKFLHAAYRHIKFFSESFIRYAVKQPALKRFSGFLVEYPCINKMFAVSARHTIRQSVFHLRLFLIFIPLAELFFLILILSLCDIVIIHLVCITYEIDAVSVLFIA